MGITEAGPGLEWSPNSSSTVFTVFAGLILLGVVCITLLEDGFEVLGKSWSWRASVSFIVNPSCYKMWSNDEWEKAE